MSGLFPHIQSTKHFLACRQIALSRRQKFYNRNKLSCLGHLYSPNGTVSLCLLFMPLQKRHTHVDFHKSSNMRTRCMSASRSCLTPVCFISTLCRGTRAVINLHHSVGAFPIVSAETYCCLRFLLGMWFLSQLP